MAPLILVRHAAPVIDPNTPSADWPLSEAGFAAAAGLAAQLGPFEPGALFSGDEPKMVGTAKAIGETLGRANTPLAGLAEHARRSAKFGDRASFEASIEALFSRPAERVYGDESADQTYGRFAPAIADALGSTGERPAIAVSGGTAISIYLARTVGIDPFPFWKSLRLPQAFVMSTAPRRPETTIG